MKHLITPVFFFILLLSASAGSAQNVGIAGSNPPEKLTVTGSLLIRSSLVTTDKEPDAAHTFNLPTDGNTSQLIVDDSTYRIYDPGGTGNYRPNDLGEYAFIDTLGYSEGTLRNGFEIVFDSIQLAPGDTIVVINFLTYTVINKIGSSYNGSKLTYAGNYLAIQFFANADANVAAGFAARVKRYYPGPGTPSPLSNYGHSHLYFNTSLASLAAGFSNIATGRGAIALGIGSSAPAEGSTALGIGSSARGQESVALIGAQATGKKSLAAGMNTVASGESSVAIGIQSSSTGLQSTAMAGGEARGDYSVALHYNSEANGAMSTALAGGVSNGNSSVAIGRNARTVGEVFSAMAIGDGAQASAEMAMALGKNSRASANGAVALGDNSNATGVSSVAIAGGSAVGFGSLAMMPSAYANGTRSSAVGQNTNAADYAHVIGNNASAGNYGIAIGNSANAAPYGYAFGRSVSASGTYSTAMGNYVSTSGFEGAFAIGDASTTTTMQSFVANGFRARFSQGYRLFTNSGATIGSYLNAGANSWAALSDVRMKENFLPVDGESFLKKIETMPLTTWNYKEQDAATFRHYGPMAQDFYEAFGKDGLGTIGCDTLINQQDFLGMNLIAIQALIKRTQELQSSNTSLIENNKELNRQLISLKDQLQLSNEIINNKLKLLDELIADKKKTAR